MTAAQCLTVNMTPLTGSLVTTLWESRAVWNSLARQNTIDIVDHSWILAAPMLNGALKLLCVRSFALHAMQDAITIALQGATLARTLIGTSWDISCMSQAFANEVAILVVNDTRGRT